MGLRSVIIFLVGIFAAQAAATDPPSCADEEILGLELTGQLLAPGNVVNQIGQDLALIRLAYPELSDITVLPSWEAGVVSVRLTNEAWLEYMAGSFAELDSLNSHYGAVSMQELSSIKLLFISFGDCYHPGVLSASYAEIDGVINAGTNYSTGDGNDITCPQLGSYIFKRGTGDCPSGCIFNTFWSFFVEDGIVSLVSLSPVEDSPAASHVILNQNTPNPFNPSTTIRFSLGTTEYLDLRVMDIRGRVVRHLRSGTFEPGQYRVTWNGLDSSGTAVASGVYFTVLEYGGKTLTQKMVVLK